MKNNHIKNVIFSIIGNIVTIIVGFIAQKIFINILGTEYLGINSVFTNIMTMLCLVEIGFGPAIIYNLYKPIATKDYKTIKSLMKFYKNIYHKIAFIILIIGLILMPFISFFINGVTVNVNLNLIYLLFVIDCVCTYLLSYKRSILYANQENYIISIVHIFILIILNILQISLLVFTKNYYLYLIVKIVMHVLENIIIVLIANKKYSYLKEDDNESLDKNIKNDIYKKVKALVVHKIAGFVVTSTDNIVISKFIGVVAVGLYTNYYLIINSLSVLFGQAITALTPSVGHLLINKDYNKNFEVFKKIRFINFWIACFTGVGLLIIIEPFIELWLGKKYILSSAVLFVLVINYYHQMMKNSYMTFKEAAGIYYEDRIIPVIESLTNIIFSIILVKMLGLVGVFIGTLISSLVLWIYSYPKYVYKKLFNRTYINYIKETGGYLILFIFICSISYLMSINIIHCKLIINIIISMIIPHIILLIIFKNSNEFKYYINYLKKLFSKGELK